MTKDVVVTLTDSDWDIICMAIRDQAERTREFQLDPLAKVNQEELDHTKKQVSDRLEDLNTKILEAVWAVGGHAGY